MERCACNAVIGLATPGLCPDYAQLDPTKSSQMQGKAIVRTHQPLTGQDPKVSSAKTVFHYYSPLFELGETFLAL